MGKRWTEEDIKILNSTEEKEKLIKLLTGRTWRSIREKRVSIGLGSEATKEWTPEELEILRSCKSLKIAVKSLGDRTEISINAKCKRLGIKFNPPKLKWSNEDIEFLLKEKDDNKLLERFKGRTIQSIKSKRSKTLAKFKKLVK